MKRAFGLGFPLALCLLAFALFMGCGDDDDDDDDNENDDDANDDDDDGDDDDDDDDDVTDWALAFNGQDDYAAAFGPLVPEPTDHFTVELWFSLGDVTAKSSQMTFLDTYDADTSTEPYEFNGGFELHYLASEKNFYFCYVNDAGDIHCLASGQVLILPQTWTHLAVTYESGIVCLFLEGKRLLCDDTGGPFVPGAFRFTVGQSTYVIDDSHSFGGLMDEIRISNAIGYDGNFTPAPHVASDENTIAHFPFDTGIGNTAFDGASNGNDLILFGPAWVPRE